MKTIEGITPANIGKRTFSIPLYQRLFAWKEENVKKLLWDLKDHFENEKKENRTGKETRPYYLGMLTCKDQELIDGQQRMTVMMLMGIILKKYDSSWSKFLLNDKDEQRIEFTARSDDQQFIKNKIGVDNNGDSKYINNDMQNALDAIEKFMNENFKDDIGRKNFAENVYGHLKFFIAELPENYGGNNRKSEVLLNKYFEAMNSAGRNLEQHEILKVELLNKIEGKTEEEKMKKREMMTKIWNLVSQMDKLLVIRKDNEKNEDFRKKYKELINLCLNPSEKKEQINKKVIEYCYSDKKGENSDESEGETIGDIWPKKVNFENNIKTAGSDAIVSFEEFLLMVLDIKKNLFDAGNRGVLNHYKKENLRKNFEANLEDSDIESFYYDMLLYRLLLDYYVIRREFDGGEIERYSLNVRDEKGGDDDNRDDVKKLAQYQSMLYVSTEFYRWLKLYLKVVKDNLEISVEDLLKNLKHIDNDDIEEHKKDKIKEENDKIKEENFVYGIVDRYWFWRLDYYLWEKREEYFKANALALKVANNYIFRRNRSIEHIAPQTPEQDATLKLEKTDRDKFGNLAMISAGLNSTLQNKTYNVKFGHVKDYCNGAKSGSIESLKMLWDYINTENETWNLDEINKHGKEMLEILKKSYE